jgi:hypothetical protein
MSYRLDLDEYPEKTLREELRNRKKARRKGLCDYCGRAPDTTPCKFPERHKEQPKPKERLLMGFLRYVRATNAKVGVLSDIELKGLIKGFKKSGWKR